MGLLLHYLSRYRWMIALILIFASTNQIFSLLDIWIFRVILDQYLPNFSTLSRSEFFIGVGSLLLATVGVAFVSPFAKNLQDYCLNLVTQKVGADLYADGVRRTLELPYIDFEEQRSGETLGLLQKILMDVERLIIALINTVFTTIVGLVFCDYKHY